MAWRNPAISRKVSPFHTATRVPGDAKRIKAIPIPIPEDIKAACA